MSFFCHEMSPDVFNVSFIELMSEQLQLNRSVNLNIFFYFTFIYLFIYLMDANDVR